MLPCPGGGLVTKLCPTLCDLMDCSMPGSSVLHCLPEFALCISRPKYCSFSFSFSPSDEYSGLIFFSIDWFDLLVVQGTLKSLLQHPSSKASVLQHSAFLMVQLGHQYMTTGKLLVLIRMY